MRICVLILCFMVSGFAFAEENVWFDFGGGRGLQGNDAIGLTHFYSSINYKNDQVLVRVRGMKLWADNPDYGVDSSSIFLGSLLGIELYGNELVWIIFSSGFDVKVDRKNERESEEMEYSLSIPFELELIYHFDYFGFSFGGYLQANLDQISYGFNTKILFGRID